MNDPGRPIHPPAAPDGALEKEPLSSARTRGPAPRGHPKGRPSRGASKPGPSKVRRAGPLIVVLAAAMASAQGAEGPPPLPAERRIIERYVTPLPTKVQAAIALVEGDGVRFVGVEKTAGGLRYLDNRGGVFEIGSISKVFTATLLARQVRAGTLNLDDPVRNLLPFPLNAPDKNGVAVTLRHLASHTSGMRHQPPGVGGLKSWFGIGADQPFKAFDRAKFERYLREEMTLDFTPGTKYQYSNMGMSLVGMVLEIRGGKPYETLLQEQLFGPLGMAGSSADPAKTSARLVPGVKDEGEAAPGWDMGALAPAGGIRTGAEDFARFVRAQFDPDPAVALTQTAVFTIEDKYHVGLGWHLIDCKSGERWLNHGGGMGGYTAIVDVNVRRRCGVVVLSNLGNAHELAENITLLARDLMYVLEARAK